MGKCPHRKVKKRRLSHKTARRTKFETKGDDTVYSELRKPEAEKPVLPLDDDLPGMGQFYCLHCDRYFANVSVRDDHFNTKKHKKRLAPNACSTLCLKQLWISRVIVTSSVMMMWFHMVECVKFMKGPAPHTQLDADIAAGMGMPDNGPKLMVA
ncbi:hypothetical protein C5167_033649 [Papaver somniferum]|uniref:C2H2-type domain-containing protein n=1 Tax=Papaver somniferum TaxID=3469 RepID=A0A4Y7KEC3_PAPSO|nr:hypothetical protein C5167_033649 [Papaver somniferum]